MTGRALEGMEEAARFMKGNLSGVSGAVNGKRGVLGVGCSQFSMLQPPTLRTWGKV
jgi:hypothetical protein